MKISQSQAQASAKRLLIFFGEEGGMLKTLESRDKFNRDSDDWHNWNLVIEEMKRLELQVVERSPETHRPHKNNVEIPDWEAKSRPN